MKHLTPSFAFLALTIACGDQGALDVGDETGNTGQALTDYAARWDGYAEAYAFPGDGEDRVRLTLDENGAGVIRFGEEALFAAANDPEGPYPPTFGTSEDLTAPFESRRGLRSGFEFAVSGAAVSGERLQFKVSVGQIMDSWCALQTAEPAPGFTCGGDGYGASFDEGGEAVCHVGDGTDRRVDCDVAQQCQDCQCDGDSCRARNDEYDQLTVDAALTDGGDTLEGTLITPGNGRVTIRMQR
jgi:hypothetical protein